MCVKIVIIDGFERSPSNDVFFRLFWHFNIMDFVIGQQRRNHFLVASDTPHYGFTAKRKKKKQNYLTFTKKFLINDNSYLLEDFNSKCIALVFQILTNRRAQDRVFARIKQLL